MSLGPGARLGPYEIVSAIGAGGMGEVYRAHDTRLKRDVAIKILPESFANEPDRLARFQREAEVLASLNHPNIAAIHGLEQSNGTRALVMELVEGETLADRIVRGPIPVDEALPVAKQIAEALEAAHEQGVIHRDLKPANVKVRRDGTVKVLDFGLAKLTESSRSSTPDASLSPTITSPAMMTGVGMLLGTAAYMSPEQARGKPADKRSDIWAFGCVLYETLTGKPAFPGADVSDVLAGVIKSDVAWNALPPDTPTKVRALLRRCLQKDAKQRLRDIGDARLEIEDAIGRLEVDVSPPETSVVAAVPRWRRMIPWALAGAIGLGLLVLAVQFIYVSRPPDQRLIRLDLDLDLPDSATLSQGPVVIISPDGTRLVYVSDNRLVTRRLEEPAPSVLPNTEGASDPFFSPDGQWIGFFAAGKLKKISVDRGAAVVLCDAPNSYGGSWGDDDTIVAAIGNGGGLVRIPSTGGTPTRITTLSPGERDQHWPQVLPGGRAVVFTSNRRIGGWDEASVEVVSLDDRSRSTLVRRGTFGRYLASGHLTYVNGGTLFAVPFDVATLSIRGTPAPVLDAIAYSTANGSAQVSFSDNGILILRSAAAAELFAVQWMDRAGNVQPLLTRPGFYISPRLSPDGTKLALGFSADRDDRDIWLWDSQRQTMTRLSFQGSAYSVWSPDGRFIVFSTFRPPSSEPSVSNSGLAWTRADGGGKPVRLTESTNPQWPWSFTPDGRRLAYQESNIGTGWDLWTVTIEQSGGALRPGHPEPFLQSPFDERNPAFSPDGRWIAYSSSESGLDQIYVSAFPNTGGKWLVSNGEGRQPVWSRAARELLFRSGDGGIMVVPYTVEGDSFVAQAPRPWSERRLANVNVNGIYDLAPDGKHIAALVPVEGPPRQQRRSRIVLLEHFFDELRRLARAN